MSISHVEHKCDHIISQCFSPQTPEPENKAISTMRQRGPPYQHETTEPNSAHGDGGSSTSLDHRTNHYVASPSEKKTNKQQQNKKRERCKT